MWNGISEKQEWVRIHLKNLQICIAIRSRCPQYHRCRYPHMNCGLTFDIWNSLQRTLNTNLDAKGTGHHHHHHWNANMRTTCKTEGITRYLLHRARHAIQGQDPLYIENKSKCLCTVAKPATAYQVYRILTTIFESLLFFLIRLQKSVRCNMYHYCNVLYSREF